MHVLRVVRVLLLVLIVAAVVGAGSSVLSARPDLQNAKRNVDTSWSSLSTQLDHRYELLAKVDEALRPIAGPIQTLVGDVATAITHWTDVRAHSGIATQVKAANNLEGLARRLVATAGASPRVTSNERTVLPALGNFLENRAKTAAGAAFNENVVKYENERRGPVRAIVASLLGDSEIPVLDATPVTT
jgi:hypothetical protein